MPGEQMRMTYLSVNDTGILGKKSECSYQEPNLKDLPVTNVDALTTEQWVTYVINMGVT